MDGTIKDVHTLIICGGIWDRNPEASYMGNYGHRMIVLTEKV